MMQNRRKINIEINAEHTEDLTRMACSNCGNGVLVTAENVPLMKGCSYCLKKGTLYPTYAYIGVATMLEISEVDVTLKINNKVIAGDQEGSQRI